MRRSRTDRKNRSKWTKAKSQMIHTIRRCYQRHGIRLSRKKYKEIIEQIKGGEAELIEVQTNRVSIYKIHFKGEEVLVVYDSQRKSLASILPQEGGVGYERIKARIL